MAKGRRYRWLTPENRRLVEERLAVGVLPRVIAVELGCSANTVLRAQADAVLRRQRRRRDSGFRLSIEERIEIGMRVAAGESNAVIARGLGRHRSTIGRELGRCGKRRGHYAPFAAERRARRLGCRPKATKLSASPRLLAEVETGLLRQWSPAQISAQLRVDYPDDLEMRISPETISGQERQGSPPGPAIAPDPPLLSESTRATAPSASRTGGAPPPRAARSPAPPTDLAAPDTGFRSRRTAPHRRSSP